MHNNMSRGISNTPEETRKKMSETHKQNGTGKWMLGRKLSLETRLKMSNNRKGYKFSDISKLKISKAHLGKKMSLEFCKQRRKVMIGKVLHNIQHSEITKNKISKTKLEKTPKGKDNWRWIKDRTKLKKSEKKWLNSAYVYWSLEVKKRDNWKCRLLNDDCKGRLESHHIFDWVNYPELRYDINNGITLCHAHHPRGRAKEKRLSPYFMELVSVSKE